MAIFRKNKMRARPPIIFETPGKIYLEGQAHDAETLTPIINDTFSFQTAECRAKTGMFTINNRLFNSNWNPSGSYSFNSSYLIDCNQGLYKGVSYTSDSDIITVPPIAYETTGNSFLRVIDNVTGSQISKATSPTSYQGFASIINDTPTQLFLWVYGMQGVDAVTRVAAYVSYNKVTGAASNAYAINSSNTYMERAQITRDTGQTFDVVSIGSAASQALTGNWSIASFNKTAVSQVSAINSLEIPGLNSNNNKSACMVSKSFDYPGDKQRVFMPLINVNSGGQLFKFAVLTYTNATTRVAGDAVVTSIMPTGSASMPGVTANTLNNVYSLITREDESYIYLTVVCSFENTTKVSVDAVSATMLHTYRVPKSNMDLIEYVRSVEVSPTANISGVLPTDASADFLVIPVKNEQLAFAAWDAEISSYVIKSRVSVLANMISIDQQGRIWVTTDNNDNLHMYGPHVANSVSIAMQANNAKYTGSVINTNLVVSALNFKGQRVANNVTLVVNSLNATFEDGSNRKTITTNIDSDLLIPIKISGAGKVQVLANLAL